LLPLLRFSFPRNRTLPATRALLMKNKTLRDIVVRSATTISGTDQQFKRQAASTLAFQLLKIVSQGEFVKSGKIKI
jgi:hypothetical protein